ncbi:SIR2 family protein [Bacteroides ovatus]|uniref:SIR2 family protein n=1 Tax=Bacteroides ovatus TaxID=28116 RepID=UPI00202FDAB4|nr:SIR2 family protein [Bacteroides ovatus]MCM1723055.1 SIR2 family protein [Bacteroides ovatus]MCM1758582.1 SIR2 family protein [Bacteroides ovatus]MCM1868637.1 SIR2 family protein [Bacteroides ovatus]
MDKIKECQNEYFDAEKNKILFGDTNKLQDWLSDNLSQGKIIDKVKLMLKNYLELDNVSFLFGTGASIHLGAVSIRNFPIEVEEYLKSQGLIDDFYKEIQELQAEQKGDRKDHTEFKDSRGWDFIVDGLIIRDKQSNEIAIEYEKVLNYLIAKEFVLSQDKSKDRIDKTEQLIVAIKEGLFNVCNIDQRKIPTSELRRIIKRGKKKAFKNALKNKYHFHQMFLKALLQRPLNLRRANIFTSNYDLAFEYAFDKLGIHYIDGFAGFHKRFFKPETFEYDIFYPGSITSGKVQRIEKVVRYFKLHGSLSWVNSEKRDANNLYGIEEKTLDIIEKLNKKGEIIIYPSAVKKSYTLDLPYSELFRQFAVTITQSQSVLITIGYSFCDEHFNDIIYQALSNPTFTLIIVDFVGTKNEEIQRLRTLNDPRIIILEGEFFGDFLTFADTLMPNFNVISTNDKIANTLNELLGTNVTRAESMPSTTVANAAK